MKREKGKSSFPYFPLGREGFDPMRMIMRDPMGSYTGRPDDPFELPVQDADDL